MERKLKGVAYSIQPRGKSRGSFPGSLLKNFKVENVSNIRAVIIFEPIIKRGWPKWIPASQRGAEKLKRAESAMRKADAQFTDQPTFWLFELDDDGTVIYSRPRVADAELEGHNFFDECLGFEDIRRYRQHFHSFIKSKKAAASFIWRCSSAEGSMDTKVMMTRAFQTGSYPPTGVVMMEIRGC